MQYNWTYDVVFRLSNYLADPNYFTKCQPEFLDSASRLKLLKGKLDREIAQDSVICLQELSIDWAAKLHVYFAQNNYHLVNASYGKKYDGYMGVGVAYPALKYDVVDVDISRISDTKSIISLPSYTKETPSLLFKGLVKLLALFAVKAKRQQPDRDVATLQWDEALRRYNQMVAVHLKDKTTTDEFFVGTYHMPCAFKTPVVMSIHCALAAQHLQRLARRAGKAYVLAGDFNVKPTDSMYQLLTEGSIESNCLDIPPPLEGDSWEVGVEPMRSAYAVALGREPDFTNYAQVKEEEPFLDTLDYIFVSKEWNVDSVLPLPERTDVNGPLPNAVEPSDHVLIGADLSLGLSRDQ